MEEVAKLKGSFQQELIKELDTFVSEQKLRFSADETLKIDLHCHDHNSDVPDEILGRILNVPETWLGTESLIAHLKKADCDVITITNHNNIRSCLDMQEKGVDVLTGAEFSCTVPDYNIGIHVLTYGLNQADEKVLLKLRKNVYAFLRYTNEHDLPTIWAHPLYHYSVAGTPPMDFFKKMSLVFERFEILNGQRDTWQNILIKTWIEKLTPDKIDDFAREMGVNPTLYCKDPYKKVMTGGSDSHMGVFSGLTGSYLHVPNLKDRLEKTKASELALEAIRAGRIVPYGAHQNGEKLTIAFLDYVCQIAMHYNDPGLLRILLHKGTVRDKITALLVSNAFSEVQNHKVTMNFIELLHNCFIGKPAGFGKRFLIPHDYKGVFDDAQLIAEASKKHPENSLDTYKKSIYTISEKLNSLLFNRLNKKVAEIKMDKKLENFSIEDFLDRLEIPSEVRSYVSKDKGNKKSGIDGKSVSKFLDGLSFPFLGSSILLAAHYTSARVLYNVRPLLSNFSDHLGKFKHPKRMLWMTDTFEDNNGVSTVLKSILEEITNENLPIDILVCSNTVQPQEHLKVIKPMAEFEFSFYKEQPLRIPNFLEIHELFHEGEYDRILCSTEGPLGLAGVYLKNAYSVPAYFYMHTDWITFAKKVLKLDKSYQNRVRRMLRAFYKAFDGIFVLNTDQQKWLTSKEMGFSESKVYLTAHWAGKQFRPKVTIKKLILKVNEDVPVLLYTGRLSKEKGVMEIPEIVKFVKDEIPAIKVVFAGSGPAEKDLKKAIPDAHFLGWVNQRELPEIYSSADLLILPSKFDTFSCSALEAMSCGLPVVTYNVKGPKDIIENGRSGFLCSSRLEMADKIIQYFQQPEKIELTKKEAIDRAKLYKPRSIMNQLLKDVGLVGDDENKSI